MKLPLFLRVLLASMLLALPAAAQRNLSAEVTAEAGEEISNLDRATQRVVSSVAIKLTNRGPAPLEGPLHAAVEFTTQGDRTKIRLEGAGVLGGFGQAPYQTPYLDLTAQLPEGGLAPGRDLSFTLRFSRPSTLFTTYKVVPHGVMNRAPVAVLDGPAEAAAGTAAALSGAASSDPDGDVLTFAWEFGDGSTAVGPQPEHAFARPGVYDVTLRVRDVKGLEASATRTILVVPSGQFALGRTRALDDCGIPLDGVTVTEFAAGGAERTFEADSDGYAVLGGDEGAYRWRFAKAGHVTVWRTATLTGGKVVLIASPWLTPEVQPAVAASPLAPLKLEAPDGSLTIDFPAGAVSQPGPAGLTLLHGQSLPLPLPRGWSPLVATVVSGPGELLEPGQLSLTSAPPAGSTVCLLRYDASVPRWVVAGQGAPFTVNAYGIWAVVVADAAPTAPPAQADGETLTGFTVTTEAEVTAAGELNPPQRTASTDPALVKTQARVTFTAGAAQASGRMFRTRVNETYKLRSGAIIPTPEYDTTVFAYRVPGAPAGRLVAGFPLRPVRLFGPAELDTAQVRADVLEVSDYQAVVLGAEGGSLAAGALRLALPPGSLTSRTLAELRLLDPSSLTRLMGGLTNGGLAFQLGYGGGAELDVAVAGMEVGRHFVLARVGVAGGQEGLQPVLRLVAGADGVARSSEPTSGPRLPGLTSGGTHVLVAVNGPQGLVQGRVIGPDAQPRPAMPVTVTGAPWLAASAVDAGRFLLVAGSGEGAVISIDPANGNSGAALFSMADVVAGVEVTLTLRESGPRVVSVDPPDGATGVRTVQPVVVRFSEPVEPGTFGPDALTVAEDGATAASTGSLSLSGDGTEAVFLAANPLRAGVEHRIAIAATLRDRQGLAIEGDREFSFTTLPPENRGEAAKLTIFEPGAAGPSAAHRAQIEAIPGYEPGRDTEKVVAIGSPGTADPRVPVILVNESTGATATVVSRADGSFANFVEASAEDFISAVFMNANGTRVTVPASRQLFDDGRVGLYRKGGILEAESEEGTMQVVVEQEAIPSRTVFRLEYASPQALQQLVTENPPESGTVAGAFRYEVTEGEPPVKPPDVIFPVTPAQLGLGPDDDPTKHTYALCESAVEGGVPYYKIVDRMKYRNGNLVTSSPPFDGLASGAFASFLMVPVRIGLGTNFTVTGRVLLARESDVTPGTRVSDEEARRGVLNSGGPLTPVPNALVFAGPGGLNNSQFRLRPGAFATKANRNGFYAALVPFNPLSPDVVIVRSLHPAMPNLTAQSGVAPAEGDGFELPVGICHVVFKAPDIANADFSPPAIQVEPGQAVLPVNQRVTVRVRLEDNRSVPVLREAVFDAAQSLADDPGVVLNPSSAIVRVASERSSGARQREVEIELEAPLPMRFALRLSAADEAGNEQTRVALLRFGSPPEVTEELELVDEDDTAPPRLLGSSPATGAVFAGGTVALFFNEAISRRCLEEGAVRVGGAQLLSSRLAADQRSLVLTLGSLQVPVNLNSSLESPLAVTVQLNPSFVTDLAGNALEGDNMLAFRLPAELAVDLPETSGAIATVIGANHTFTLRNSRYEVVVHPPGADESTPPIGRLGVPAFPRAMAFLPDVTFFEPNLSPPPFTQLPAGANPLTLPGRVRTANLLAVTGGLTGEDQVGPWLWIIDVSDPSRPVRLASSLVTGDFTTAASILKWSPPRLGIGVFAPEGGRVMTVNIQALIIGSQGYVSFNYGFGLDLNFDRDFVDPGERPPVPRRGSLFGLEDVGSAPDQLSFTDFDMMAGGSQLAGVTGSKGATPARFHVLRWPGVILNEGDGVLDLPSANYRVLLDPAFPLEDESGVRPVPAAILAGGNRVLVVSLADPERPVLARNLAVAPEGQALFFLAETGRAEIIVAGRDGMRSLSRSALGAMGGTAQQALWTPLTMGSGRLAGATALELATYSSATGTRVLRRTPRIGVIQFRDPPSTVEEIRAKPESDRGRLIGGGFERGFLRPVLPRGGTPGEQEPNGFREPDPAEHHYVLVRASGANGAEIRVGVRGLTESETATEAGKCPLLVTDRSPEIIHMRARRISDDNTSDQFNQYLAGPFVLVTRPLSEVEEDDVGALDGRQALWSGDFIQAFLAADPAAAYGIIPYMASESGIVVSPGVATAYRGLRAEYLDSPNPSPGAAPRVMGGALDLQSGEVTLRDTDVAVEGRHQALAFRRTYQSQSYYLGPLGRNWDHNFNARIQELGENDFPGTFRTLMLDRGDSEILAGGGDVVLIDGAGGVLAFRRISEANGNLARLPEYESDPALNEFFGANGRTKVRTFYESPTGVHSILVRLLDLKWVLIGSSGNRIVFHPDGRLDRLIGSRTASVITCHYRPRDGMLGEVRGDNGGVIRFGYYYPPLDVRRTGPIDLVSESPAECGRLAVVHGQLSPGPGGQRVEFKYDAVGNLVSATPSWRRAFRYSYDENVPGLLRRIGEEDGGTYPEAFITYVDGMAKTIITGGETMEVSGSLRTATERFRAGSSIVSFGGQGEPAAQLPINRRGQPESFGGRAMTAAEDGTIRMTQTANEEVKLVFDDSNEVRRFRGNLIRTERRSLRGGEPRVSTTRYDGTAFNRVAGVTDINGIETTISQLTGEVREVTGGVITRQSLINEFGQPTAVSLSGGAVAIQHQPRLDPVNGLPSGVISNTTVINQRDDIGRVDRQIQGAFGFDYQFDPATGRLMRLAPRAATVQPALSYVYDGEGRVGSETLGAPDGIVSRRHEYLDPKLPGKPTRTTTSETGLPDSVTEVEFDDFGRAISTRIDGIEATMGYEGTVLTSLESPSLSRILVLDEGARVASISENGITTSFAYDDSDRLQSTRVGGRLETFTYHPGRGGSITELVRQRVISAPDAADLPVVTETLAYDGAGRLASVTSSNGRTRSFAYHSNGVMHRMLINGVAVREVELDAAGRVVSSRLGNLRRTLSGHHPDHGRPTNEVVTWLTSGRSVQVTSEYDASGRRIATIYPNGRYQTPYDAFGNVTGSTDPDSVAVQYVISPLGVPRSTRFADGTQATYVTGPMRRPVRTDSAVGSSVWQYGTAAGTPDFGQVTGVTFPDGASVAFSDYNEFKRPERMVISGLVEQALEYDEMGRLTGITSEFDGTEWSREFDALDRLASAVLGDEEVVCRYNAFGNLSGMEFLSEGESLGEWRVQRDALDRTLTEQYPSGLRLEFAPDEHGQPTQATGSGIVGVDWMGLGAPAEVRYAGGVKTRWHYDAGLRLEKIEYLPPGSVEASAGFEYALTAGGRVTRERRIHEQRRDEFIRNGPSEAMRITGALFGIADADATSIEARVAGFQFLNGELSGPQTTSTPSAAAGDPRGFFPPVVRVGGSNRIATIDGVAVQHDVRGSMNRFPVWVRLPGASGLDRVNAVAEWDALGMLVKVTRDDGVTVDYTRDAMGKIVVREVAGPADRCRPSITRYFWAGDRLLEERDAGQAALPIIRRYHYLGGKMVLMEAAAPGGVLTPLIPLQGLNGSVGGYMDNSGVVRHVIHYGLYGLPFPGTSGDTLPAAAMDSPLLFHGAFFDAATGLLAMGQRHLHPLTGGFLERDSRLFGESLAWFSAFNGDPASRTDPGGTLSEELDALSKFKEQAEAAQALYEPARMLAADGLNKESIMGNGAGLVTAGYNLWLTTLDDEMRTQVEDAVESAQNLKDGYDLLGTYNKLFKGEEEDDEPTSVYESLKDPSELLLLGDLTKDGMDYAMKRIQADASVIAYKGKMQHAPQLTDSYEEAIKGQLDSYDRSRSLLALSSFALDLWGEEALGDKHSTQLAKEVLSTLGTAVDFAETATRLRGAREIVNLRVNPIEALETSFKFGFEAGKLGIVALSDPDVAEAYRATVKQFEDDGGWLTVGSGILSTLGADDTAFLLQRIQDTEIDVAGEFLKVYENAMAERDRRQMTTEFYLRALKAP